MPLQDDLFPVDRCQHGAVWTAGNYQCRNFHGYYQCREGGEGNWMFQVPWFCSDDKTCTVYRIGHDGHLCHESFVPIDAKGRITILGRRYDRDHWDH